VNNNLIADYDFRYGGLKNRTQVKTGELLYNRFLVKVENPPALYELCQNTFGGYHFLESELTIKE
jgi:hypothetical protein